MCCEAQDLKTLLNYIYSKITATLAILNFTCFVKFLRIQDSLIEYQFQNPEFSLIRTLNNLLYVFCLLYFPELLHVVNVFRALLIVITFAQSSIASTFFKVSLPPALAFQASQLLSKCGWVIGKVPPAIFFPVAGIDYRRSSNWTNPLCLTDSLQLAMISGGLEDKLSECPLQKITSNTPEPQELFNKTI